MRWIVTATAVLVVLAGCGPDEGGAGVAPGESQEGLDGTEWVLTDGVAMVEGYAITLRVEDGQVGGTAACNSYGGTVAVTEDGFEVGDIARTEMGCPDPGVHDSESAYLDALQAVERYERTDSGLLLAGPDVELRFDAVAPLDDAELTGTPWQLESLLSGTGPDATASSTQADATLRLDDDGTITVSDGCNDLTGRWTLEGDVLAVSDLITTDVACPPLAQQVEHVQAVLQGEPTVALDGRRLSLVAGDRGLDYRAP